MELSGKNYRSVAESRNFSFYSSFTQVGKTGIGLFSLSGENKEIRFSFDSGRMFDPDGKYIYSYGNSDSIEISGNVETTGYSYYINNEPFAFGKVKDNFKLQRFHYHSTGMNFSDVYTEIRGTEPSYFLDFPDSFISSGYHTGHLVNNSSDLGFEILSASLVGAFTGEWGVASHDEAIAPSSSGKIVIQDLSGLPVYETHKYKLNIDTNFGRINSGISGVSNPSDFRRVLFDVQKTTSGLNETGFVTAGGNVGTSRYTHGHNVVKVNTYNIEYLAYSGTSLSGDKPLHISLEYLEGPTGDFFGGPDGSVTAYADYVTRVGSISNFSTFPLGASLGVEYSGTTLTGVMTGVDMIVGSGYAGETSPFIRLSAFGHTGSVISGYSNATGQIFTYASGLEENSKMSGVTGIEDFHNVSAGNISLGLAATGSGLLTEYYNGSWNYGSEYVATTGLLQGLFSGQDMVAADLGSKFYQEYITGSIDALTTGGAVGAKWGAKLVNSSLKAPSHPSSGVTGVTLHSGYWTGEVIASGLTFFSGNSNYTGALTGYEKTFTGAFDIWTGSSGSFQTSGYYWGQGGNVGAEPYTGYKIYPDPYMLSSGEIGASVSVGYETSHDESPIVALLTISGMNSIVGGSVEANGVYQDYLTGIR